LLLPIDVFPTNGEGADGQVEKWVNRSTIDFHLAALLPLVEAVRGDFHRFVETARGTDCRDFFLGEISPPVRTVASPSHEGQTTGASCSMSA
jgi:hypothetical protein